MARVAMEWFVKTPDGRTLAVEDAGDHGGRPVMVHVGTPGGRRLYGPRTLADAERRQLRLISYDRPGYGGSTPQPGRSMADCASDVRVICEALGIERRRSVTASGWPRASPASKPGSSKKKGTASRRVTSRTSTPGC